MENRDEQLKQAYEILGLKEGAPREELNKRYDLLLRQFRSHGKASGNDREFEEINKAYKLIIELEDAAIVEQKRKEHYAKYGKLAKPAEKVDDFLRLHKIKVLISLIAVIVIIVAVVGIVNHKQEQDRLAKLPPIDLKISYIGNFSLADGSEAQKELEQAMLKPLPDWKRLELKVTYLPQDATSAGQYGVAMQQKAQLEVMTEKPDIYILDKSSFEWLANGAALESLDSYAAGELKSLLPENAALKTKTEYDEEEHIYGIDVTNSSLAKELPIGKQDMIIAVRIENEISDKTLQFIKAYLQAEPKS